MIHDEFPDVALHNVAETAAPDWADGGHALRRAPASVAERLNVVARDRMRHPTGCEIRFVPASDGEAVDVTLSAAERTAVRPYWGPFQDGNAPEIGPTPRTLSFAVPDRVRDLDAAVATGGFDPRVCRLRFERTAPVAVHDVRGACRAPRDSETPDARYLAYGTSITEGFAATGYHLSYVSQAARVAELDAVNLGTSGSAFCEPAMAEYVAGRADWDLATLALSVNMANRGFTREQFAERVRSFVRTVAGAGRPVVCVTLFPYHADLVRGDDRERAAAFRGALRAAVDDCGTGEVRLVEGPDLMDATGLTTDLLHPGDAGMTAIGSGLADVLGDVLD